MQEAARIAAQQQRGSAANVYLGQVPDLGGIGPQRQRDNQQPHDQYHQRLQKPNDGGGRPNFGEAKTPFAGVEHDGLIHPHRHHGNQHGGPQDNGRELAASLGAQQPGGGRARQRPQRQKTNLG